MGNGIQLLLSNMRGVIQEFLYRETSRIKGKQKSEMLDPEPKHSLLNS